MDPKELRYAKTHEWVHVAGDIATVGITDFAVHELTDLVYIELPAPGRRLTKGSVFGVVESVKAASDLYSPVTGEVIEANTTLSNRLETLSTDPFGAGWMIKVKITGDALAGDLLDHAAYQANCGH